MAKMHQPDLIPMDLQLPGIDGYEAARQIKAEPRLSSVPIIAVTSFALSGDEERAFAAGCSAYISKPYSPRQLLARIRERCQRQPVKECQRANSCAYPDR